MRTRARAPLAERPAILSDEERADWDEYLGQFERDIWPLFEKRGFSKGEAAQVWWLNRIRNQLDAIGEALDGDDDAEAWKR